MSEMAMSRYYLVRYGFGMQFAGEEDRLSVNEKSGNSYNEVFSRRFRQRTGK
jgi:hypothetical protein